MCVARATVEFHFPDGVKYAIDALLGFYRNKKAKLRFKFNSNWAKVSRVIACVWLSKSWPVCKRTKQRTHLISSPTTPFCSSRLHRAVLLIERRSQVCDSWWVFFSFALLFTGALPPPPPRVVVTDFRRQRNQLIKHTRLCTTLRAAANHTFMNEVFRSWYCCVVWWLQLLLGVLLAPPPYRARKREETGLLLRQFHSFCCGLNMEICLTRKRCVCLFLF